MASPTNLLSDDVRGLFDHAADIADADPFDISGVERDEFTEPETHAVEYLEEHGLEVFEVREERIIFTLPEEYTPGDSDLLLKVARYGDGDGTGQSRNETERAIWANATDEEREHLAPVLDAADDNAWVVIPQTEPIETEIDAILDSGAVLTTANTHNWTVDNISMDQMGVLPETDQPVLHDYGRDVVSGE